MEAKCVAVLSTSTLASRRFFFNCSEFYYIQMEKYARMAISEGVRSPNELTVSVNSELYRALALHYNRNQQIEVSFFHFKELY